MRARRLIASALLVTTAAVGGEIIGQKIFEANHATTTQQAPKIDGCATALLSLSTEHPKDTTICDGLGYNLSSYLSGEYTGKAALVDAITSAVQNGYDTAEMVSRLLGICSGLIISLSGISIEYETRHLRREEKEKEEAEATNELIETIFGEIEPDLIDQMNALDPHQ